MVKVILGFIEKHEDFLMYQSGLYALCSAYFAASVLCFKYLDKLFYLPGLLAGLGLFLASFGLFFRSINHAQKYFKSNLSVKNKLTFSIVGIFYASTVICVGYAVFYQSVDL